MMVILMISLLIGGCGTDSRERLDLLEGIVAKANEASTAMTEQLTTLRQGMIEMQTVLADPNLALPEREKIQALLTNAIAQATVVAEKKAQIDAQINIWQAKLLELKDKDVTYADELILYGQAASQVGPLIPAPVGPLITLGGILAGTIGTILAKRAKKVSSGLVHSVNTLLANPVVTDVVVAKAILQESQETSGVRESVRKLM